MTEADKQIVALLTTISGGSGSGSGITALTGDVSASGTGSVPATLATVFAGGFAGTSGKMPVLTINPKGLTTAASEIDAVAPAGTLTGTTLAPNVVTSSLTSVGTLAGGTLPDSLTYTHDLTAAPNQTGGWNYYNVVTTDFTTTATVIGTDVTGLVTGTLTNSAKYIFEADLEITHDTDTGGVKLAIHGAGTGSAATVYAVATVNGGAIATGASIAMNQIDTATVAVLNYASAHGSVRISGSFYPTSTGTATMSIQIFNVTAGNAVVKKGSVLRIRKATV